MEREEIYQLLGAEEAQDDPRFLEYAVVRPNLLKRLRDPQNRFLVINAARGAGKSGLLLSHEADIARVYSENHIVIKKYQADVGSPSTALEFPLLVSFWKHIILGWLVANYGAQLAIPIEEHEVAAANYSERVGARPPNSIARNVAETIAGHKVQNYDGFSETELIRIMESSSKHYWLLLDEMDTVYDGSEKMNLSLVALMQASKYLTQQCSRLAVRITIRPHIMAILQTNFDVVQKMRQNEMGLSWDWMELQSILSNRIKRHLKIDDTNQFEFSLESVADRAETKRREVRFLIGKFFDDFDMSFAQEGKSEYRALHTICLGRPRWMIEFCSIALEMAGERRRANVNDFRKAAYDYGSNRIRFLIGEHRSHFPALESVINQLTSVHRYALGNSQEFKQLLISEVVRPLRSQISGGETADVTSEGAVALNLARMLYMTEFVRAKQSLGKKDHRFITFSDKPSLLASWGSDDNLVWEMHPTFARGLNILDTGAYKVGSDVRLFAERKNRKKASGEG